MTSKESKSSLAKGSRLNKWKSEMEKISVVVAVYNGEKYLHECLDSILDQNFREMEVVLVDDASKDSTLSILEEYRRRDNRLRIISNKQNLGAGASRNIGLEAAKGKYVIFLDADDIFEKNMLQEIYQRAEKYRADVCIFREDQFYDNTQMYASYPYSRSISQRLEKAGMFSPKAVSNILFNLWNGWAWDKLFLRKFILKNRLKFQEIRSSEDGFFVHAALAMSKKITYLNDVYVHHRINNTSSISNSRDQSWECCYLYLHELRKYLLRNHKYENYKKSFINWAADFLYWNFWTLNENSREKLFYALKEYILYEFKLLQFKHDDFYNPFFYWFVHTINKSNTYQECEIPVDTTGRWLSIFTQNESRIDQLFQYLSLHHYNAAVWGAGIRGKTFLHKYRRRNELKKIFDKDTAKIGNILEDRYIIESFNYESCKEIDVIIVTNTSYYDMIMKEVKEIEANIKVFDLELYQTLCMSLPLSLEDCML